MKYKLSLLFFVQFCSHTVQSQFLMDMVDTTKDMGKGMLLLYKKFDHIKIGGYIQPQFQVAEENGARSFNGGDFPVNVNNRFMLRRGRIRFDYIHLAEEKGPSVQVVFQFDGTERGVFIRDFWGRVFENKYHLFSLTAGMFARPFGFETNLSSGDRESPERGRMNQLLMKTERDLGVMLELDARKNGALKYLKIDAGFFNGQGLTATADFDNRKDFISRVALKPINLNNKLILSAAVSYLNGGFIQSTKYKYELRPGSEGKTFEVDSSTTNLHTYLPRKYHGADIQLKIRTKAGYTELRAEYIAGTQTATLQSSETPAVLLTGTAGYYIRRFNGAYFYLLRNIINSHHQAGIKYDWFDPNTAVAKNDIGNPGTNLSATDIKYSTIGFGYIYYVNENLKVVAWYDKVMNEHTNLPGFTADAADNIFTLRMQFRF